jgi:hypothetical protein
LVSPEHTTRITYTKTATSDNPFRLTDDDVFYYDLTVWVQTNDAYIGSSNQLFAPVTTSQIYYDRNGNLKELWFKNYNAGSNCVIIAMVTVPTPATKKLLGLID